jgi:hypothetical protein
MRRPRHQQTRQRQTHPMKFPADLMASRSQISNFRTTANRQSLACPDSPCDRSPLAASQSMVAIQFQDGRLRPVAYWAVARYSHDCSCSSPAKCSASEDFRRSGADLPCDSRRMPCRYSDGYTTERLVATSTECAPPRRRIRQNESRLRPSRLRRQLPHRRHDHHPRVRREPKSRLTATPRRRLSQHTK